MAESYAVKKRFEVPVDLKRPVPIREFEVVEGDTGNEIEVTVTDGGVPVDLDGHCVIAVFSHSNGVSCISGENGIATDGNKATISLMTDAFSNGMVECELQIYSSTESEDPDFSENDILVTTAKFNFKCRKAILNGDTTECEPHFPLLTGLIGSVEEAETARAEAEASRVTAENGRAAAEQLRVLAENGRVLAESARASAENARAQAEAARALAEAERAEAEADRESAEAQRAEAEALREAAEAQRDAALAEHIAQNGLGVLSGEAPTSSTEGEAGRLRFDTAGAKLFVCKPLGASYKWTQLETVREWEQIADNTLPEDVSVIEFTSIGGSRQSYSELRLVLYGCMKNSAAAAVKVNGSNNCTFTAFTSLENAASDPVTLLSIRHETADTVSLTRLFGGVTSNIISSKNVVASFFRESNALRSVSVTATGTNGLFKQGMRVVLEGR